ncbi:hypothetical protein ANCDUO_01517 [Ancylostoma duodenale]|uniref:Peptidase S9A N-terminal domain-containing protein n=1 Tax=Ancylostoma duodenale TaxID=51022 RepID=A0A0C2DDZ4_9BILA|nr:hypothetical protein ANCDUO_01517 [Ancylostoma duodenale]
MRTLLLLVLAGCSLPQGVAQERGSMGKSEPLPSISIPPATYPTARRDENIVDDFDGIKVMLLYELHLRDLCECIVQVGDPYRWLEDPDAPETRQFVSELNAISEPFLAKAPNREDIRKK